MYFYVEKIYVSKETITCPWQQFDITCIFVFVGLSRVEEVEHENTMAMLEKERGGEIDEVVETSDTYTEEIIYYSPRKSGHYTSKEVCTVSYYLITIL
jgi:hypothetical protein